MLKIRRNKKTVKLFKDTIVSDQLRDIFLNICSFNKFSENDYSNLSESEKQLFDDILTKAKLDPTSMLYKHKKYNDVEKNELINRFNVLKGEILAGNDNYDILKELKKVIIRLMHMGVMDQNSVNAILNEILYVL